MDIFEVGTLNARILGTRTELVWNPTPKQPLLAFPVLPLGYKNSEQVAQVPPTLHPPSRSSSFSSSSCPTPSQPSPSPIPAQSQLDSASTLRRQGNQATEQGHHPPEAAQDRQWQSSAQTQLLCFETPWGNRHPPRRQTASPPRTFQ